MTLKKGNLVKDLENHSLRRLQETSLKEYLVNAPESKCDLVDGQYFHHSPATIKHNKLRRFIEVIMDNYIQEHNLGTIISENIPVKLDNRNWREPDIAFISKEGLDELHETIFTGTPDLIIEILSEDSFYRDTVRKRAEYEQLGVKEYWIIDPDSEENSIFLRLEGKRYTEVKLEGKKIEVLCISGLFFLKEWIWPEKEYPKYRIIYKILGLFEF